MRHSVFHNIIIAKNTANNSRSHGQITDKHSTTSLMMMHNHVHAGRHTKYPLTHNGCDYNTSLFGSQGTDRTPHRTMNAHSRECHIPERARTHTPIYKRSHARLPSTTDCRKNAKHFAPCEHVCINKNYARRFVCNAHENGVRILRARQQHERE